MDTFLVIGAVPGAPNLMKTFTSFEEAVDFVNHHDATGRCWIKCPDLRWYHPNTNTWRS